MFELLQGLHLGRDETRKYGSYVMDYMLNPTEALSMARRDRFFIMFSHYTYFENDLS